MTFETNNACPNEDPVPYNQLMKRGRREKQLLKTYSYKRVHLHSMLPSIQLKIVDEFCLHPTMRDCHTSHQLGSWQLLPQTPPSNQHEPKQHSLPAPRTLTYTPPGYHLFDNESLFYTASEFYAVGIRIPPGPPGPAANLAASLGYFSVT